MKARRRKPAEDWTGQIGMGVGEQRQRSELEGSVQKRVVSTLESMGIMVWRWPVGRFKTMHGTYVTIGRKGDADLACFMFGGIAFFVETKRGKGGVITEEQHAFAKRMRAHGFVSGFATTPEEAVALAFEARTEAERRRAA